MERKARTILDEGGTSAAATVIGPGSEKSALGTSDKRCFLYLANHGSLLGVGEIVYTLHSAFSREFEIVISSSIVPDAINVIIDEFAHQDFVRELTEIKRAHPRTRYVVVATEFVTRVRIMGLGSGKTFNFSGEWPDWKSWVGSHVPRSWRPRPYMYRRYAGFVEMLDAVDLLVSLHPRVLESLRLLPRKVLRIPKVEIYPEIGAENLDPGRLRRLCLGFSMSGNLTGHRNAVADRLVETFHQLGYTHPIYQHEGFTESAVCAGARIRFLYDQHRSEYLFNLNPPQKSNWSYSSPMRILRAVLVGQIPVVTRKFGDHEIEDIAQLWDEHPETTMRLIRDTAAPRDQFVNDFIASVRSYDQKARIRNTGLLDAVRAL
jgi:hypothetical protein